MNNISRRAVMRAMAAISATAAPGAAIACTMPLPEAVPVPTPSEQAMWHARELYRLAMETGAYHVGVIVIGLYDEGGLRPVSQSVMIDTKRGVYSDELLRLIDGGRS